MSGNQTALLKRLCECEPGKGIPLYGSAKKTAGQLIDKGLALSVGFGNFHVFIATDKGRKAVEVQP